MSDLNAMLGRFKAQNLHAILKNGLPAALIDDVRLLCAEYGSAGDSVRRAMKAAITPNASSIILRFMSGMAELAMQEGNREAIDIGLVAFDLSNIVNVDPRDAFAPAGALAFAARKSGVDILSRATTLIPDMTPQVRRMFEHPKEPDVTLDSRGKLVFRNPWAAVPQ